MERLAVYGSLITALLVSYAYPELLHYARLEVVFPVHVLFHLLSYSIANPTSLELKAILVCFMNCFGDLMVTCLLLLEWPPKETGILIAQFVLLLLFVRTLKVPEVHDEFRNSYYRTALFLGEAYLKSTSLSSALQTLLSRYGLTYLSLLYGIIVGVCKMSIGPVASLLTKYWGMPWSRITWRSLKVQAKTGFFLSPMLMAIALATDVRVNDWFFSTDASMAKAVANTYFLLLFTLDAVGSAKQLT